MEEWPALHDFLLFSLNHPQNLPLRYRFRNSLDLYLNSLPAYLEGSFHQAQTFFSLNLLPFLLLLLLFVQAPLSHRSSLRHSGSALRNK